MIISSNQLNQMFDTEIFTDMDKSCSINDSILFSTAKETFTKCLDIMKKKNHDYSRGKDEFRNFKLIEYIRPKLLAEDGIIVRLCDKFARISNLLDSEAQVSDETIEDTIDDAINYFVILKAYLRAKKIKGLK